MAPLAHAMMKSLKFRVSWPLLALALPDGKADGFPGVLAFRVSWILETPYAAEITLTFCQFAAARALRAPPFP